ncbi:hypothetical protein BGZ92_002068 [Podila epicladia]|nr:hypothetical protein BGZ92_002068 [Podila epicladia]
MGVFGEKHTSLTREQKRQLIYQADTQKLRPTEVCAWVMATWGLRIARVTVYSILHKQRASLMEGYTQESIAAAAATVASLQPNSTSKAASALKPKARLSKATKKNQDGHASAGADSSPLKKRGGIACLASGEQQHGRIHENKYRTSASSGESNSQKRCRSASVASDRSMSSSGSTANHEGARWEGQLKRVREPASAELDRAMVEFLKSPASVDAQGRRLNDAELQVQALKLAQSIPSAQRMRCSFGWLRHFKRRLGVHWRADPSSSTSAPSAQDGQGSGKYRWVIENEQRKEQQNNEGESGSDSSSSSEDDDGDSEEYFSSRETLNTVSSPAKKRCRTASVVSSSQLHSPQSILATFSTASSIRDSNLFNDALPPLHVPCASGSTIPPFTPVSSTIDPKQLLASPHSTSFTPPSAFGMSVDGKMRKVPSKEEAYDMLQSLLLYYEQDHCSHAHYVGEQQTLLLPRWIHQQRQIIAMTGPTSQGPSAMEPTKMMAWMNQHQNQYPFPPLLQMNQHHNNQQHPAYFPYHPPSFPGPGISTTSVSLFPSLPTPPLSYHSGSNMSSSTSRSLSSSCSPPALSPLSELGASSPISPMLSPLSPLIGGHSHTNDPLQLTTLALEKQMAARRESLSPSTTLPLSMAGLGALAMW